MTEKKPLIQVLDRALDIMELLARAEVVESKYGLPARRWARSLTRHAVDGVLHF